MDHKIVFYAGLALMAFILLAGATLRPKEEKTFFDRVTCKEIQGLLAVFIMFHHIVIFLNEKGRSIGPLFNFFYYGILAVGFFFFCSGFGLLKRWITDKNYIQGFMKRRVFTVLVPFFFCNYIYLTRAIIGNFGSKTNFRLSELVGSFFGFYLVNMEMWFAVEIMILYLAFRIVFARVKRPLTGIIIMTAVVIAMMAIGLLSGHPQSETMSYWFKGEWWYNTIFMFPLGMIYAFKEERINTFIRKAFGTLLALTVLLIMLIDYYHRILISKGIFWTDSFKTNHLPDKLLGLGLETVFEIAFIFLVLLILSRVRIGNSILRALGKISLEIIMMNYLVIDILYFLYEKYGILVYVPAVMAGTLICAAAVYWIKNIVLERRTRFFDGKIQ